MNIKQTVAAWIGILAAVLTLLYPVCDTSTKMVTETDFSAVHRYLFTWPSDQVRIDYGKTTLQLGIIVLLTGGAVLSLRSNRSKV